MCRMGRKRCSCDSNDLRLARDSRSEAFQSILAGACPWVQPHMIGRSPVPEESSPGLTQGQFLSKPERCRDLVDADAALAQPERAH